MSLRQKLFARIRVKYIYKTGKNGENVVTLTQVCFKLFLYCFYNCDVQKSPMKPNNYNNDETVW